MIHQEKKEIKTAIFVGDDAIYEIRDGVVELLSHLLDHRGSMSNYIVSRFGYQAQSVIQVDNLLVPNLAAKRRPVLPIGK